MSLIKLPTALLPLLMSLGALAAAIIQLVVAGPVRKADENAVVHLWQLLMAGQVPIVALFAFTWLPRARRSAFQVLMLQAGLALVALIAYILLFLNL